jgi:hypothetical protein
LREAILSLEDLDSMSTIHRILQAAKDEKAVNKKGA